MNILKFLLSIPKQIKKITKNKQPVKTRYNHPSNSHDYNYDYLTQQMVMKNGMPNILRFKLVKKNWVCRFCDVIWEQNYTFRPFWNMNINSKMNYCLKNCNELKKELISRKQIWQKFKEWKKPFNKKYIYFRTELEYRTQIDLWKKEYALIENKKYRNYEKDLLTIKKELIKLKSPWKEQK